MLRNAAELYGYRIEASDGEIGRARDFFFDDAEWTVRYLVVDTGTWLPGRRTLISPVALASPDRARRRLPVLLSREAIEKSPAVSTDKPVSRQQERSMAGYFGWAMYWSPMAAAAGVIASGNPPPGVLSNPPAPGNAAPTKTPEESENDPHLRSMREVVGYRLLAPDGEIGHVDDFIIEDHAWIIRYLVIDTRNWLPGKRVLLAPHWCTQFKWAESTVGTILERETIRNAPEFDSSTPITREFEARLHGYYKRPGYWDRRVD